MKKFLTSILALIYLLAGSGLLMQQHYCMGELVEEKLSLVHADDIHMCDKCGMEQKSSHGCCEQKTQLIKKVSDDQVQQDKQQINLSLIFSPALLPVAYSLPVAPHVLRTRAVTQKSWQKPPPDLPLFLAYNNLRI